MLFAIPMFLPIVNIGIKGGAGAPALLLLDVIDDSNMDEFLSFIGIYTLLFGVPAIGIGWVIQSMIVRAKGRRENKVSDTRMPPTTQTRQIH